MNITTGVLSMVVFSALGMSAQEITFPASRTVTAQDTVGSTIVPDPYRWLEDKSAPEVQEWTQQQSAVTEKFLSSLAPIEGLRNELRTYFERDVVSAPFYEGEFCFQYRRKATDQQYKLYVLEGGKARLLFDPHTLSPDGKAALGGVAFTKKGDKTAIGVQFKGDEIYTYYFLDTKTGKEIAPPLTGLRSLSWCADGNSVYISRQTREDIQQQKPTQIFRHILNSSEPETFLLAPSSAQRVASVYDTREGNKTIFSEGDFYSTTLKMRPQGSNDEPKLLYTSKEFQASVSINDGKMYIFTNHQAPNYKLMVTELDKPEFDHWKDLYPEQETVLESYAITSDWLLILDKADILRRLRVFTKEGSFQKELTLPETGNIGSMRYHRESNTVYVSISTFTAPRKVYALNGSTLQWTLFYEEPAIFDLSDIEGKIVFYPSKDGTKVPMFIVHKKDINLNGANPTLLYGYGGFNVGIEPSFIGTFASFVKRGGIYAVAGLRGGDEYGENWHKAGMLKNKQNTFDDFFAAAEYLFNEKYTSSKNLVVYGGSNGGLLIGATLTQRPDICNAAICGVPLLDMARFHKFLIARYWIPEYGDPDNEEDLRYILTYSPYHNIKNNVNYPTTIVTAGENDTRVDPLHAKKFVAAMQARPEQKNPIFLQMEFDSGHGSGKPIAREIEEAEKRITYILRYGGYKGN